MRAVRFVNERGRFLVADARQDARRDLDHGGLDAELGGGGRDFEPDQPAADHQQRLAAVEMRLERQRLGLGAQIIDARARRKHRQDAVDRAGGEHQRVIGDALACLGHYCARGAVDLADARAAGQRDAESGETFGAGDRRVMRRCLAGEHGLRQRRLLVGLAAFVGEHHHVGRGILLARGDGGTDGGRAAADDHDLFGRAHARSATSISSM